MKLFLKIFNIMTIVLLFVYIVLTFEFYYFLEQITGNLASSIYLLSSIPYYLLWISVIITIVFIVINIIKKEKQVLEVIPITSILIFYFLLASILFTPRFEFLYYNEDDFGYPKSVRYDKLFVYNSFYSNEDDYEGGRGNIKYLYIPIIKKIIYIKESGIKVYNVKYLEGENVKIGDDVYYIKSSWFDES